LHRGATQPAATAVEAVFLRGNVRAEKAPPERPRRGTRKLRKMPSMPGTENSANNSAKPRRGNPDKTKPFRWPKGVTGNPGGPRKKPITEFYAAFADAQVSELPARIRKKFKDCDDLSLAAAGALGLFVAMGEGNHSAAKELREGVEGKLAEKVELAVDVNKDVVGRLLAARMRLAKKADAADASDRKFR
jgi:hypothetical protein